MGGVESKERAVRQLYDDRRRRDWPAVRAALADGIVWHEPGDEDYSGDHRGAEAVLALLQRLVAVTGGTFTLEPADALVTDQHVAVRIEWSADRAGLTATGQELAVYRVTDGRIAEAWFFPDGYDPAALTAVFRFADRPRAD